METERGELFSRQRPEVEAREEEEHVPTLPLAQT